MKTGSCQLLTALWKGPNNLSTFYFNMLQPYSYENRRFNRLTRNSSQRTPSSDPVQSWVRGAWPPFSGTENIAPDMLGFKINYIYRAYL